MKIKLLLPALLLLTACGGESNVNSSVHKAMDNIAEVAEAVEGMVLKKDARLIGGDKSELQTAIDISMEEIASTSENRLVGYWIGEFGENKINVSLAHIENNQVSGYSICAGNYRSLIGEVTDNGDNTFKFVLDEPGDDKYDGKFEFSVDLGTEELTGSWTPYKEEGNSTRNYTLGKRTFEYVTGVGKWPEASERILAIEDVENLLEDELSMMRNEIYARHGYCFKNKEFRNHFEAQEWYMPMGVDIRAQLTEVEAKNIDLIYEYETYYEEYYDDYGR
ncbi:MAG: YARHG domain-containing protein [Flavobacteriales bacterium]|nr:YARHG domain-containing protein [Flavobacteriales bacterium]